MLQSFIINHANKMITNNLHNIEQVINYPESLLVKERIQDYDKAISLLLEYGDTFYYKKIEQEKELLKQKLKLN